MALDTFTTTALVRADAGFTNEVNVLDATIEIYVNAANGEMASAIGSRYQLPLSANTNYSSSAIESYLQQLATTLGAGLLMLKQYEGQGGDMDDLAIAKIESVRSQLKEIQKGNRALFGSDGNELNQKDSNLNALEGCPSEPEAKRYELSRKF